MLNRILSIVKSCLWFAAKQAISFVLGVAVGYYVLQHMLISPPLPANSFGSFVGKITSTWLPDGRTMKLDSDFAFIDPQGKPWAAPAGSIVDGASIPSTLWSFIGGPFEGKYRDASVIHDVACGQRTEPSAAVHVMFYNACRCSGVDEFDSRYLYWAVSNYGPQWEISHETHMVDGQPVKVAKAINVTEKKDLSKKEAKEAYDKFKQNKRATPDFGLPRLPSNPLKRLFPR